MLGRGSARLTLSSALLYSLAFNLTFFIQELFLVVPKALTPGLHVTLFHNNHHWVGSNPLASLFQGTGALATLTLALACLLLLRRPGWSRGPRLFLAWMVFSGVYMALPQVILGTRNHAGDVGMAMDYLGLGSIERGGAALAALLLMLLAAWPLRSAFLEYAPEPVKLASASGRAGVILRVATLPALLAIPLIVPFRIPREPEEVLLVPMLVSLVGMLCVHTAALIRGGDGGDGGGARAGTVPASAAPLAIPLAALVALLLFFQLVLRRGIPFG